MPLAPEKGCSRSPDPVHAKRYRASLDLPSMTRRRVPARRCSRGRLAARLLVCVGALAGLFAMHGLNGHGAASHELHAPLGSAVVEGTTTGHAAAAPSAVGEAGAVDAAPDQDSADMAMAGLCLAVLVGAVIGLVLRRLHRVAGLWRAPAIALLATRRSGRRDRDPPCQFELCVLRT